MEKEGEKNKNKESSSSGTKKQKISQSLWCVFCSALAAEIERARASKEDEKARLLQFMLQEHQKASHPLN
jgi:competence protein ComGF